MGKPTEDVPAQPTETPTSPQVDEGEYIEDDTEEEDEDIPDSLQE